MFRDATIPGETAAEHAARLQKDVRGEPLQFILLLILHVAALLPI
jgi:hypothetical protein